MDALKIYPLAHPKGRVFLCELCGTLATLQCAHCKVTYYCGEEHMKADVDAVHRRICHLLAVIRTPSQPPAFVSIEKAVVLDEQRKHQQLSELISVTEKIAMRLLYEDKPSDAIPAALQSLRCAESLYGARSVHLVPPFLMLAEACVGMKRFRQASSYQAQAEWLVLQHKDCPFSIKHRMYRVKGIWFAAQRRFDEARRCFADDIYHASEAYGTEDIRTTGGYFHLGKVFHELNRDDVAEAMFDTVTDIWCDHLTKLVRVVICGQIVPDIEPYKRDKRKDVIENQCLDEAEAAEATLVLNMIYLVKNGPQYPEKVPKTSHCLAMLYFLREDSIKAEDYGRLALYETEDLPYRRDAEKFVAEYTEERKKQHARMMGE